MITQENIPYTADEIKAMVKTCEKYNKALERARQFSEHPLQEDSADIVEYIFPELVGSEDEKMRKMCMRYLDWEYQHCYSNEDKMRIEKCIAWLEKQGQTFTKKDVDDAYLQGTCDAKHEIEKQGKKLDADDVIGWLEKHYLMTPNGGGYYYLPKDGIKQFKKDFGL